LTVLFLFAVILFRFEGLIYSALYFFLLFLFTYLSTFFHINFVSSINLFIPLVISTLLILPFRQTRSTFSWLKFGTVDRVSWIIIICTSFGSVAALIAWALWTNNLGLGVNAMRSMVHYPLWLLALFGIPLYAMANAFVEEAIFRGIVQEAAMRTLGNLTGALFLQSTVFAAAHFKGGFPNGAVGYCMVLIYGIMLGVLRVRCKGLLAPWLAHVIADMTIGYFLLYHVYLTKG
jgi:hypothetical protein